ncbi:uncharacterized protein LOC100492420 isoform X1 [Xenopus tropicalis]|nr:uncharacterized protein LOC100492420 isoform X1 [Xenopus tropicalis]
MCGQIYSATVSAINTNCSSPLSAPANVTTVPCKPRNVTAQIDCSRSVAQISWALAPGALHYTSILRTSEGVVLMCNSTDLTCEIGSLQCGQVYTVTVTAFNDYCASTPSFPVYLHSVPCVPTEVHPEVNCASNVATVQWAVAKGAVNYTVTVTGPLTEKYKCQTANTSCSFPQLSCGLEYNASVVAVGHTCSSDGSAVAIFYTVPCVPTAVQAGVNCDSNLVTVTWNSSLGALNYTAVLTGPDGDKHVCQGVNTMCSFSNLSCGLEYNTTVSVQGYTCSSQASATATIHTVPCRTTELNMQYNCNDDNAELSWKAALGALRYTATVSMQDMENVNCSTTQTSCIVYGINCGQIYTMTVETFGVNCNNNVTSTVTFPTAPCVPEQQPPQYSCDTNTASLSWGRTLGAARYISNVTAPNVETLTCNTSAMTCNITDFHCGQVYTSTVSGINTQCRSLESLPTTITTVPCQPQNVTATIDCTASVATVSWDIAPGALRYSATLQASGGEILMCNSTERGCQVKNLQCGQIYTVTVTAFNEWCQSASSSPIAFESVPCVPTEVHPVVNCASNVATVQWAVAKGAVNYTVTVTGPLTEKYKCQTANTSCSFPQLSCGLQYNASVVAVGHTCSSDGSAVAIFYTVPCVPTAVQAGVNCDSNLVTVTWNSSLGALNYTAVLTGPTGDKHICHGVNTMCSFSNLSCGLEYNTTVSAQGYTCSSQASATATIHTVPCRTTELNMQYNCNDDNAELSWKAALGALRYTATVSMQDMENVNCSTTQTSCIVYGINCGQIYTMTVETFGVNCNNNVTSTVTFPTAPCVPEQQPPQYSCDTNTASLSWGRTLGAARYISNVTAPNVKTLTCNTSAMTCNITDFHCGQVYTSTVSGINTQCRSLESVPTTITTVPCQPQNVTATIDCTASVATVSWDIAPGALRYSATLQASGGEILMCNSTELGCQVKNLQCGQIYTVTVTAFNEWCQSASSSPIAFESVPCVPTEVHPEVNCASNVATVQWAVAKGAVNYTVTVTGPLTEKYKCQTANTSCSFPQLSCGLQYNASVVAVGHTCSSDGSAVAIFYTVPCVPSAIQAGVTCDSNLVTVTWNSSLGALNYTAVLTGPAGDKHVCQGVNTMCSFSNLSCGLEYNTTVSAQGYTCSSQPSATATIQAVPCRTTELNMQYNCNDDNAELSWKAALGALRYTATVSMQDMENVNCSTRQTSCIVYGINCGQIYTMTVETFGVNCNNNVTSTVTFPTAPCVPEQHPPQYSCDTNTASLSWGRTLGAARYISNVTAPNVETLTCNTSAMTCNITDFHCGQVYTSTVSGISTQCRSLESLPTTITTVPCQPQNVTATIDCTASVATVSWDIAPGALRYSATLQASGGEILMCNSTELGCQVKNLQCGQIYTVTVTAFNEWCQSASSSPIALISVPCVPTKVQADISCESNVVNVSWAVTPGAVNYTAVTSGPQGQQFICHALNRACTFPRLACGTEYNVTIAAVGNTCSSAFSQPISVQTVPCQPKNISAQMICSSSVASVSWYKTSGALRYLSTLTSSRGVELTCNSTNLGCEVGSLRCGESYSVSVSAFNNECEGAPSVPTELLSVPCVPSHVQAKVSCTSNNTIMSWAAAEGAVNYIGLLTGAHGEEYECQEVGTSCNFTQLSCGLEYNATVFSVGHTCSSNSSEAITVYTTPCLANDLHMQYQCGDDHATLSWGATLGALMYIASVTTQHGETLYCNSTTTSCVVSNIKCGKKYNMTVESVGRTCRSKVTFAGIFSTGPCVPQNFTAVTDCEVNSAVLSWSKTPGALNYTALAIGPDGKNFTCDTESTTCRIPSLHCGFTYNVSVIALNEQCVGESSTVLQLITAPCAPETLQAEVGCVASSITLSWEQMADAHSFTSYLTGHDGLTQTCNSTEKKCVFLNLPCGQIYSATVSAFNSQCTGPISNAISIETAPCIPTGIKIDPLCGTEMESLWWNTVPGADMYYAEVTGVNEWTSECITQNRTCNITGLACGQPYNITLTASNSRCNSTARPVTFYTAPCVPSNINAVVVCGMNTADISWAPTKGALNYSATVVGRSGKYSCSTKELTCNAELPQCGQTYTVTVTAVHDQCSTESLALQFHSAPCRPENVAAIINCDNSTASVTWDSAAGAQSYISNISGPNGEAHSCNTTLSTCDVGGMQCGHIYNVTVTAVNEQCSNLSSVLAQLKTGPCVPQILDVNFNCAMDFATLSWGVTPGAESYEAILIDSSGRILACNTTDQICDISELICGENYNATVIALNDQCTSEHSPTVMVHAVPCPPDNINTSIYHANVKPQEVRVSWSSSHCGIEYMATLQGAPDSIFTLESYWTPYMEFFIPVPCSSSFNATVMARNGAGASRPSVPVQGYTAPCPPQVNVAEVYGETMRISWSQSVNTEEYRVLNAATNATLCVTASLACEIPFTENVLLVIAVNLSGESDPSILPGYNRTATP